MGMVGVGVGEGGGRDARGMDVDGALMGVHGTGTSRAVGRARGEMKIAAETGHPSQHTHKGVICT